MYINHNISDPLVINNILHNSEFNKDLTYQEIIDILDKNTSRYSVVYTISNMVLHITDNEGICYYDINISVKEKKIYINIQNEINKQTSIIYKFNYTETKEKIDSLFKFKYCQLHTIPDYSS